MGMDIGYAKSCFGILKILEFISLLIAWACLLDATSGFWARGSRTNFFLGVSITAFVLVIIWFCLYLFMLCGHFAFNNKMLIYAIIHLVFFVLLLVAGALIADSAANLKCGRGNNFCDLIAVTAAFGLFAALLFLIDAYMHYKGGSIGGGSSGTTTVTKTVITTRSG